MRGDDQPERAPDPADLLDRDRVGERVEAGRRLRPRETGCRASRARRAGRRSGAGSGAPSRARRPAASTSPSMKSRIVSRRSACSGERSRSTAGGYTGQLGRRAGRIARPGGASGFGDPLLASPVMEGPSLDSPHPNDSLPAHHHAAAASGGPIVHPNGHAPTLRRELVLALRTNGPSSPDQLAAHRRSEPDRRPPAAPRPRGGRPRLAADRAPRRRPAAPPVRRHPERPAALPVELRRPGRRPDRRDRRGRRPGARRPGLRGPPRPDDRAHPAPARGEPGPRCPVLRARPRAGGHPGRAGLPRARPSCRPTARSGCASTTARSSTSPRAIRPPARPSWPSSGRCSARTSSGRPHIANGDRCCTYRISGRPD